MDAKVLRVPEDGGRPQPGEPIGPQKDVDAPAPILRRAASQVSLRNLTFVLLIAATSLYLLERLEPVLRPLLIAVLLSYLFLPVYTYLRRSMRPVFSFLIIVVAITLGLQGLARMVYRDVIVIDHNLPRYMTRVGELEERVRELSKSIVPRFQKQRTGDSSAGSDDLLASELSQRVVRGAASAFLTVCLESIVVAFYMIFLLQSASRLPDRIRSSFSPDRASGILQVTQSINKAISEYLVVKVKASLLVGIPVGLACWGFGVTGAVTWGVITFFGNFLPYVGALVAIVPPLVLAFLEFPTFVPPLLFALVLLCIHGVTANLIEPAMTGKALGLSPLVVLVGLAFWSLLWGFVGMVLAVPLTVIFKIILEHTPATRPLARLISDDQ